VKTVAPMGRIRPVAALAPAAFALWLWAAPIRAADVPYVTTPQAVVDAMLKIGSVGANDYLIDLGSGDGRIVITAAKRIGTRGFGVDLDDNLVRTARRNAEKEGVADRVAFQTRNLFDTDISKASVITMYLLNSVNLRLRPSLFGLKPGTRIVSHDFDMGKWTPDAKVTIDVPEKSVIFFCGWSRRIFRGCGGGASIRRRRRITR
jgi:SAM-dependent methyltransferase